MKEDFLLLTITGQDKPGVTSKIVGEIAKSGGSLEDAGQSLLHNQLSLSFLINTSGIKDPDSFKQGLKKIGQELSLEINYQSITNKNEVLRARENFILNCISFEGIKAPFLFDLSTFLASKNINIERIDNTSSFGFKTLSMSLSSHESIEKYQEEILKIGSIHKTDIALLKDDIWLHSRRLVVMDMDSTLIQNEVIDEMANHFGVAHKIKEITDLAMNGKMDFNESLLKRVSLLKGFKEEDLKIILGNIKLTEGAKEFIKTIKKIGLKTAIISGGFNYFANHFKKELELDYAFSNELEVENGILTGKIKGSILNADKKAMLLELIAQQEGINLEQVVAIGDGANDLLMLKKAGLGIAFHAKDVVKKEAKQQMSYGPMTSLLYFLGLKENSL